MTTMSNEARKLALNGLQVIGGLIDVDFHMEHALYQTTLS